MQTYAAQFEQPIEAVIEMAISGLQDQESNLLDDSDIGGLATAKNPAHPADHTCRVNHVEAESYMQ